MLRPLHQQQLKGIGWDDRSSLRHHACSLDDAFTFVWHSVQKSVLEKFHQASQNDRLGINNFKHVITELTSVTDVNM